MDSALECIGIYITDANEFAAFAATAGATAMRFGTADSAELFRWEDASGARLVFAMTDDGRVRPPAFVCFPGTDPAVERASPRRGGGSGADRR